MVSYSTAQQKANADSLKQERQRMLDSSRTAQKRVLDSTKAARTRYNDSVKTARKIVTDSLATIRQYRESKKFKDSVAATRQQKLDEVKNARMAYNDSLKKSRQHILDSTTRVRKAVIDSIKTVQKKKTDSLGAIRAYRTSKRYTDSVAIIRQQRLDSARTVRKNFNDSLKTVRTHILDSAAAVRKKTNDSLSTVRKIRTDSLETARKARTDSLAKKKADRAKMEKVKEKKREEKMQLALELKIKKKHQAWSNEKMLKRRWSAPRRVVQNTFTRFNYYFNADKKMDEAMANMLRAKKENYDSTLALFPFDPDRDSNLLKSDMDTIIQKASLGIQIHDPRTKWGDDLYLLLGQAYYYKGDYENATSAFRYIISVNQQKKAQKQRAAARESKKIDKDISIIEKEKEGKLDFLKHKSVNNDAVLWLARTYTEARREGEAESVLDLLDNDKNLTEATQGRLALEKANLNLSRGNSRQASPQLAIAAADSKLPRWIRTRAAYLNGQLLDEQGDYKGAAEQFQQVIDLNPKIEMDFYARKNLANMQVAQGTNPEEAMAGLKNMLNDGKYAPYHEQVYYILGRLAANGQRYDEAITYLQKSVNSVKSTKKQKAISFSTLGTAYYAKGDYRNAKLAYDSASYLAKYAANDPDVTVAMKRAGVLDKVAYPTQVIREQDSLLTLSAMSEKEQRDVVRRLIRNLEKAKEDSIQKAESGDAAALPTTDAEDIGNIAGNWYFSNPVLMQQGLNDFKRKWGNRTNVDNWRRGAKQATGAITELQAAQTEEELVGFDENGIPTELSLLAVIPSTAQQKDAAKKKIEKAYLELGAAYVNDVNDYPSAQQTLDTFDTRFPDTDEKAQALYIRYQLALKQNELNLAQNLSDRIRKEYAKTKWAELVGPAQTANDGQAAVVALSSVSSYYDETYNMIMQRDYTGALSKTREGQKLYKQPNYNNRFKVMEAIALAGSGQYDEADSLIKKFIAANPNDSVKRWAIAVQDFVKKARPVVPVVTDTTGGMPVNIITNPGNSVNAVNTATPPTPPTAPPIPANNTGNTKIPPAYTYDAKTAHAYIFYFYKAESRAMGVKVALNDFNTFNYSSQKLKSTFEMLQENQGIITVKSFPSLAAAKIYMNAVSSNKQIFKEFKTGEYQPLLISEENLEKLKADKDILPYLEFYKKRYK
ncbi:MAG TPA: tetratricopeptide repeat protein [Flavipsychrobacter sp.]|nr:tetratricopeptide repeat protein [Flavipsychrobacter sp.]